MHEPPLSAARASGLVAGGQPLLVMLSGGADSVCLLEVALRLGAQVSALHVNYGLRAAAEHDEAHCRALCESQSACIQFSFDSGSCSGCRTSRSPSSTRTRS